MGWRPGIWAGFFGGSFLAASGMAVTWIAVSQSAVKPLPWWPLLIFAALGVIGVVGFFVSIYRPHVLPGHKKHLEEKERLRQEELKHEAAKARVAGNVGMFQPVLSDTLMKNHTDALNRYSATVTRNELFQPESPDEETQ